MEVKGEGWGQGLSGDAVLTAHNSDEISLDMNLVRFPLRASIIGE